MAVRIERDGAVAVVTMSRPEALNAFNTEQLEALRDAVAEVAADRSIRCAILTGEGRAFAAGADIKEMAEKSAQEGLAFGRLGHGIGLAINAAPQPWIAAINGHALGGGCEVALACDFRVVAKKARLGQPEILLGIIPGAGGTQRLARLVGPARAKDLIFSGRFITADEALAIGLVDEVVDSEEPDAVYQAARARMAPYVGGPAYALRAAKEAIDRGLEVDLETGLQIERMLFASLFATKDQKIGMDSFIEHGPGKAKFSGS